MSANLLPMKYTRRGTKITREQEVNDEEYAGNGSPVRRRKRGVSGPKGEKGSVATNKHPANVPVSETLPISPTRSPETLTARRTRLSSRFHKHPAKQPNRFGTATIPERKLARAGAGAGVPQSEYVISESQLIATLRICHGLQHLAAKRLGCTQGNISLRIKASEKLQKAWKGIKELRLDKSESVLYNAIDKENSASADLAIRHLKMKGKKRGWTEQLLIGSDPEAPLVINIAPMIPGVTQPVPTEAEVIDE